ncbi:alpha/beta hydrolase [Bowmanella denitrificans]|uniref:Alpha/beta hydrolase n=1 Tax=Bowmanella denitrificans TaxID=366582 RepID=A0ABN0XY09_9ALTE
MMDKETTALLAQFNQQVPDTEQSDSGIEVSRNGARAMFIGLQGPVNQDCRVTDLAIPGLQGKIPARLYRPLTDNDAPLPLVLFIHGGGWALGDLDCYDALVRDLCQKSGCLFVSLDYRLAPEHPYPAGLDDVSQALNWVFTQADTLNASPAHIAIMGDSAGGNLALAASHRLHSQGVKRLAAQYLIYPVLDVHSPHEQYPSRLMFGGGDYLLANAAIDGTRDWYLGGNAGSDNPEVSPMLLNDLAHLPPTALLVAGFDPLKDEGERFARRLQQADVLLRFQSFESTIHAFLSFGDLPVAQEARLALAKQLKRDLAI